MSENSALLRSAVCCFLLLGLSNSAPSPLEETTMSLVVSTDATFTPTPSLNLQFNTLAASEDEKKEDPRPSNLKIYQLKVDTNVTNRYAKTLITSKVRNLNKKALEAVFSVVIPEQAFISGFTMEIDGKSYDAYVQEKEEAKNTYNQAVASGQSAGHVAVSARDSNRFTVSVNVEPQSKATFYLKYEELLARKNEKYEVVLNIHPGQPVKDLEVTVNIYESRPLKFVETPALRSGNEISKNDTNLQPDAEIKKINDTATSVIFNPNVAKQKELAKGLGAKNDDEGLSGQFVVQYDVERDPQGGEVLVDGGYFVHFFSPEDLPALPKQVVFVLDTSGSMDGIRITQLKQAMNSILGELKPEDIFSIVEFSSDVKVWNVETVKVEYKEGEDPYSYYPYGTTTEAVTKDEPKFPPTSYKATPENINKAKEVIKQLQAFGGTDIQSALKVGLEIVKRVEDPKAHQPILIFLTDGEPTVGISDTKKITSSISELNIRKTPIFSLSFGDGADKEFLEKISLQNQGFSRHIYEAADAYLQLEDFYRQISSPLLTNVTFKYTEDSVKNVTRKEFPILFKGGELVTCGLIDPGFKPPLVEGWGKNGIISLQPTVYQAAGSLERLWAYQTIKQILRHRELSDDKERYTQEALKLALKYSFVTDVSSLVVVKPNASSAVETEDGSKTQPDYRYPIAPQFGAPSSPFKSSAFSSVPRYSGVGYRSRGAPSSSFKSSAFSSVPRYSGVGYRSRASYGSSAAAYAPLSVQYNSYARPGSGGGSAPMTAQFEQPPSAWGFAPSPVGGNYYQSLAKPFVAQDYIIPEAAFSSTPFMPIAKTSNIPNVTPPVAVVTPPVAEVTPPVAEVTPPVAVTSLPVPDEIMWLSKVVGENEEIELKQGTYKLGLNETITEKPECQNAPPANANGTCSLVLSCPEIHPKLTDLDTYSKYFCDLQGFAGVCCPTKSTEEENEKSR